MLRKPLIAVVRLYQIILSPFVGQHCRFYPTCSEYACDALHHHGCVRGSLLTAIRLAKCHPFNRGGFDPVPKTDKPQSTLNSATNKSL